MTDLVRQVEFSLKGDARNVDRLRDAALEGIRDASALVLDALRVAAPRDTGTLAASLRSARIDQRGSDITAELVGSDHAAPERAAGRRPPLEAIARWAERHGLEYRGSSNRTPEEQVKRIAYVVSRAIAGQGPKRKVSFREVAVEKSIDRAAGLIAEAVRRRGAR